MACENCGCSTDHARQPVDPALYARTAPAFNCITYPGAGPHYTPHGDCVWCGRTAAEIAAQPERGKVYYGRYTHIVKRASGYIAGWFVGEPPASFIKECNDNVPDDPAHAEEIPPWPDDDDPLTSPVTGAPLPDVASRRAEVAAMRDGAATRREIDDRPQTPGNPYVAYTPESRVFEIAQDHGQQAAAEAIAGLKPDQAGYRALLAAIPTAWTRPSASIPKLRRDDLPGYSVADLMSQAGWVPHDGTDLRDELAAQYEQQARTAFWNEIERIALRNLPTAR